MEPMQLLSLALPPSHTTGCSCWIAQGYQHSNHRDVWSYDENGMQEAPSKRRSMDHPGKSQPQEMYPATPMHSRQLKIPVDCKYDPSWWLRFQIVYRIRQSKQEQPSSDPACLATGVCKLRAAKLVPASFDIKSSQLIVTLPAMPTNTMCVRLLGKTDG